MYIYTIFIYIYIYVCVCVYIYIYIYAFKYLHIHLQVNFPPTIPLSLILPSFSHKLLPSAFNLLLSPSPLHHYHFSFPSFFLFSLCRLVLSPTPNEAVVLTKTLKVETELGQRISRINVKFRFHLIFSPFIDFYLFSTVSIFPTILSDLSSPPPFTNIYIYTRIICMFLKVF